MRLSRCCVRPQPRIRWVITEIQPAASRGDEEDGGRFTSLLLDALKACNNTRCLESGKRIHYDADQIGFSCNSSVSRSLLHMYVKCRSLRDARAVFETSEFPSLDCWTALMTAYANHGEGEEALELFRTLKTEGYVPDDRIFVAALMACSKLAANEIGTQIQDHGRLVKLDSLKKGMDLHAQAVSCGCDSDIFLASTLVDFYAKCGSMVDSQKAFDRIPVPVVDVVPWNSLIQGYALNGEEELALEIFQRMQSHGSTPNSRTFVAAVTACANLAAEEEMKPVDGKLVKACCLEKCMELHAQAQNICSGGIDMFLASSLVALYAKCGSMIDAREVFDKSPRKDVVLWNSLIVGYADNGEAELALESFSRMQNENCSPIPRTFVAALMACSAIASKEFGKKRSLNKTVVKTDSLNRTVAVHAQAAKAGCQLELNVASTLVDSYARCGSLDLARQVFDRMPAHHLVTWNSLLMGYADNGEAELALESFRLMRARGCLPDGRSFVGALVACVDLAEKEKEVLPRHDQIKQEESLGVTGFSIQQLEQVGIQAQKQRHEQEQQEVMDWRKQQQEQQAEMIKRNTVQVGGVIKFKSLETAMEIHSQTVLQELDRTDVFVSSALVEVYVKCGSLLDARMVFDRSRIHNIVVWTALIMGYAERNEGELALELYAEMKMQLQQKMQANSRTFVAVLAACGSLAAMEVGRKIHEDICRSGLESDQFVGNSLVDFYCKCGCLVAAEGMFDSMVARNLVTWSSIVAGYSREGDFASVFEKLGAMEEDGFVPNEVTCLSVLAVCSHAGLVARGKEFFKGMKCRYGVDPGIEHFHCMVDLLGRANRLEEALAMAEDVPGSLVWKTILGACSKWKNVEIGKLAFERLVKNDEQEGCNYVLMTNIYRASQVLA